MSELDPTQLRDILQRKAGELVARRVKSPIAREQHLVLHWKNEEGFGMDFNLSLGLRKCPMTDIFHVMQECRKELTRRGVNPRA